MRKFYIQDSNTYKQKIKMSQEGRMDEEPPEMSMDWQPRMDEEPPEMSID